MLFVDEPGLYTSGMRRLFLTVALLSAASVPSVADTVITLDSKSGTSITNATIYLSAIGYRYETAHAASIFRPEQNVVYDMTPGRQRYTRVTPEALQQAAKNFDAARRDWGDRLNAMSDERRHQIEAAYGPASITSASPLVFKTTDMRATFGDWHCQMLHVMLGSVQHGAVCVVPLAEVGLNEADVQVLRRLTEFMLQGPHPMVGIAAFWDFAAIQAAVGYPAFPIDAIIAVPSGWFEYTVRTVEKRPAPVNAFDLPPGMTEEAPPRPGG